MKPTLLLLLLVFAVQAQAQAETLERTLANGMKVIVKTDRRAPVAVSQVWYRVGSMDESNGTTGVAHALEHMMFKGTKDVPAGEFSKRIAAAGGRENAFTARDHTAYFQTLQADRLELALKLEADRMANLTLAPEEFAKEINVVMEERRMRTEDNPQARLYEVLMATAFQVHPYRHPVIGWMDDLKNMTAVDAKRWYSTWYVPNNATLVVVGDVDPAQVMGWAEQYFGVIPARELPVRKPQEEPEQQGIKEVTLKAPAKLPAVILSWQAPRLAKPAADWEPYALEVLAGVLDGNGSARLPKSLVKEKQLAVDVSAGYDPIARGPDQFMVDATPAEGKTVAEVEAALKSAIKDIQDNGVAGSELSRVKAQVLASQVFQQDSLFYQGMQIGEWETAGLSWKDRAVRFDKLKAVTAEQIREVARKYLIDDRLTVAVLDPQPMPADAKPQAPMMGGDHVR
ncbi:MAG: pitrilysin family protein [Gallionellaceae bacterium]|nr:pitrilysin family protein [Gallionellaceae bacterium]